MKALSLKPYWAMEIFEGRKTIECRTWKTDYRGDILICSSNNQKMPGLICGRALIVAHLVDIVPFTVKHLEAAEMDEMPEGKCYAWIFDGFDDILPFKVKSKLHLFDIDDDLITYIDFDGDSIDERTADYTKYLDNIAAPMQYQYKPSADFVPDKDYIKNFFEAFDCDERIWA